MSKPKKFRKSKEENKFDAKSDFKSSFKYYKSRNPPPDLSEVIDVDQERFSDKFDKITLDEYDVSQEFDCNKTVEWRIYKFKTVPGILMIKNVFSETHQIRLADICVKVLIFHRGQEQEGGLPN